MSWTYSGNPADNPRDQVRFLLGDTVQNAQSLTDEEIYYLITLNPGNPYRAAAEAAGILHTRYIGLSSTMKRVGDLTLQTSYAQTAAAFATLEKKLMRGRTAFDVGAPVMFDDSPSIFGIGIHDETGGRFPDRYL